MLRHSRLFAPLLVAPLVAAPMLGAHFEGNARGIGQALGTVVSALQAAALPASPPVDVPDALLVAAPSVPAPEAPAPRRGKRHGKARAGARTVFIDQATVLRLAESGVVPVGRPVPRTAEHPAGIRVTRVSALGLGVLDGDVLTEVENTPVLSTAAVVARVLALRVRHEKTISARFFRAGEAWSLVVEMPYPPPQTNQLAPVASR